MKCTKAVIAVAGYGTRRLPITKSIEKCMIPVLNRPVIDYVVHDCIKAGIKDIYFVVSGDAVQLRSYYSRDIELEEMLQQKGKDDMQASILPPTGVRFHYITQDLLSSRYGTALPVQLGVQELSENESVLVIMGDQFLYRADQGSDYADLIGSVDDVGADGGLLGAEVAPEDVYKYGMIETDEQGNYQRIIEKPAVGATSSTLNNASVYVFPYSFLKYLDEYIETKTGGGEYMITDVVNHFVAAGNKMIVVRAAGAYLDCGTVEAWVDANNFLLEQEGK